MATLYEEVRPRLSAYKWKNIKSHVDRIREYHKVYFRVLDGHKNKKQQHHAEVRIIRRIKFDTSLYYFIF